MGVCMEKTTKFVIRNGGSMPFCETLNHYSRNKNQLFDQFKP